MEKRQSQTEKGQTNQNQKRRKKVFWNNSRKEALSGYLFKTHLFFYQVMNCIRLHLGFKHLILNLARVMQQS